jgi:Fe-coproporphyrin III synthase
MLQIPQYYKAIYGEAKFPKHACNAPWVSAVIESNGDILPCFFHKPYGNIADGNFEEVNNTQKAVEFRRQLNVGKNETCVKCVCSLHISPFQSFD